jgi:hypothetical protein
MSWNTYWKMINWTIKPLKTNISINIKYKFISYLMESTVFFHDKENFLNAYQDEITFCCKYCINNWNKLRGENAPGGTLRFKRLHQKRILVYMLYPPFSPDFKKSIFSTDFRKNNNINFYKIRPVDAGLFHASIFAFC